MSLFHAEKRLMIAMFGLLEQANLAPQQVSKPPIDTITVEDVEHEGQEVTVLVEILEVDSKCRDCGGDCEAGGPNHCRTCRNTGESDDRPCIELGRAWMVTGMFPVTLSENAKEYVREVYFEKLQKEAR